MAKTTGEQNIPSELRKAYQGTLGLQDNRATVGKRKPFRLPYMRTVGGHPSPGQLVNRTRFKDIIAKFNDTTPQERARWFDNMPPWNSFLWYYNYFIMSGLVGNANVSQGGCGVIKSIQTKQISMPAGTGEGSVAITEIDPAKAVVMLQGSSYIGQEEEAFFINIIVYPYISSIAAELLKCKWAITSYDTSDTKAATISATIIEYI